jgi:hypothetical protein
MAPSPRPEIPFPDFFLVGAPRCGTTAITNWLKRHPQVCFSKPKEPHYFTKVEPLLPNPDLRTHYLDASYWHYDPARHRRLGEGSVSTLYAPEAIARILSLNDDARFVAVVRNPLDMLPSFHALLLYYMDEDVEDFETAWRLQQARARGESLPPRCLDPRLLQYVEMARLGKHVEALIGLAGRDRCQVVVYDDLVADPLATYRSLLDFLGLDEHEPDLRRRNESRGVRLRWLHRTIYRPPLVDPEKLIRFVAGRTRKDGTSRLRTLRKRLIQWNTVPRRPEPLPPALREELRAAFAEDVERLGKLLDRDLSAWQ